MFIPDTDYEAYQTRRRQERQQAATPAPEAPDFWNVPNTGPLVPSPTGMDGPVPRLQLLMRPPIMPEIGASGPIGGQTRPSPITQPLPPPPLDTWRLPPIGMPSTDRADAAIPLPTRPMSEDVLNRDLPDFPSQLMEAGFRPVGALNAALAEPYRLDEGPKGIQRGVPWGTGSPELDRPGTVLNPRHSTGTQLEAARQVLQGERPPMTGSDVLRVTQPGMSQRTRDVVGFGSDVALDPWNAAFMGAGPAAKAARSLTGPGGAGPAALKTANEIVTSPGLKRLLPAASIEDVGQAIRQPWQIPQADFVASRQLPGRSSLETTVDKLNLWLPEIKGAPGIQVLDKSRFGPSAKVAVFRDANGAPQGILVHSLDEAGKGLNEVAVAPAFQRQGVATKLYKALEDAGYDVNAARGAGGYTEAGAAMTHRQAVAKALAERQPVPPEVLRDYPGLGDAATPPVVPPRGIDDVASIPSSSGASRAIPPEGLPRDASRGTTPSQVPPKPPAGAGQRTSIESAGTPPPRVPPVADADSIVPSPRGYPAKKAGFEQVWNRDRNVMEHQGEAGRQLAARMHESREIAHQQAGDWISRMPTVRQLDKAAFDNFVDVAEGKAVPRTAQIEKAAQEWAAVREEVWATAKNAGLPVGEIKNYFPHRYDPKLFKGTDRWNKMIDHLVASKQAATRTEAEQMLDKFKEANFTRFGNLERERVVDLPGFERTPQALMDYVYGSAKRIGQATQFGPENEIGARLITEIGRQGGDTGAAQNILHRTLGTKEYGENMEKIARVATIYNVITKMGTATVSNATQPANTATVAGLFRTIRHIPEALVSKEAKDYALRIGVTVDGVVKDAREGAGWSTKAGQIAVPFFNPVEKFNRTLTAVVGREFAQDMGIRWVKSGGKDAEAGRALEAMKLDPASIMARKGKLSLKEETQASRNIVERTQFYVDAQDLPGWTDSPWGKVVRQFRTFQYNQSAFMAREILEPAIKYHNFKPLATFLLLGTSVGAGANELKNLLRNRPSEEDPVQRVRQYYQQVGGFGVVGDLLGGFAPPNTKYLPGERYALQAASTAFGPSMGTVLEGAGVAALASQGKWEGLQRFGLKQIPVVGPTVKNTLMPYKPGGRGGELTPLQRRMQQSSSGLTPLQKRMQQAGGR